MIPWTSVDAKGVTQSLPDSTLEEWLSDIINFKISGALLSDSELCKIMAVQNGISMLKPQ